MSVSLFMRGSRFISPPDHPRRVGTARAGVYRHAGALKSQGTVWCNTHPKRGTSTPIWDALLLKFRMS